MPGKLIPFPYVKGAAEYAVRLQEKILELGGKDLIIAVDLPEGLTEEINRAVEKLPRISLIVDEFGRAIPIVPTDAGIEAVRSSLEYDYDISFLDAGMPINKEIIRHGVNFHHLIDNIGIECYSKLLKPFKSEYQDVRENYTALKLKEILKEERTVLFVCDIRHYQNILNLLEQPVEYGMGSLTSTITCNVKEADVWKISPEIPFIMSIYESSRKFFNREDAILKLYQDDEIKLGLVDVYRYARNLAISDGQLYPDLYNILCAAKYGADDEYAYNISERAKIYPYTYLDSNCEIKEYIDYDLEPLEGQRILEIKNNLQIESGNFQKKVQKKFGMSLFYFRRTVEALQNEEYFAKYLRKKYFFLKPSDEYRIEEFQNGLGDGIAIRESIRYRFLNKLYIKNDVMINKTAYVVELGRLNDSNIYFDTQNYFVGTAGIIGKNKYSWGCFTMLPDSLEEEISGVMGEVDSYNPLISCTEIGLKYSDFTYIFTNHPEKLEGHILDRKRMKILPLNGIPRNIRANIETFEVNYDV